MKAQHGRRVPGTRRPDATASRKSATPPRKRRARASGIGPDPKTAARDPEILTDTLWILGPRDRSGAHVGDYHGNFVPQIPRQLMLRFTRPGDVVVDAFAGSGTTLIEARRLGRHAFGVELLPQIAAFAESRIAEEPNPGAVSSSIVVGDSAEKRPFEELRRRIVRAGRERADLAILHPPYHDIIKFSEDPRDLCNCGGVDAFLGRYASVVDNVKSVLAPGGRLGLVVGDMYRNSEVVPLGFLCMQRTLERGFQLKAINVKDIINNRAKRNQENLWRYRALAGGFYIFRHEYVFVFRNGK